MCNALLRATAAWLLLAASSAPGSPPLRVKLVSNGGGAGAIEAVAEVDPDAGVSAQQEQLYAVLRSKVGPAMSRKAVGIYGANGTAVTRPLRRASPPASATSATEGEQPPTPAAALKTSELVERAEAEGASGALVDQCMDAPDIRGCALRLLSLLPRKRSAVMRLARQALTKPQLRACHDADNPVEAAIALLLPLDIDDEDGAEAAPAAVAEPAADVVLYYRWRREHWFWPVDVASNQFTLSDGRVLEVERLSESPRVFRVPGLLSAHECDEMIR